MNPLQHIKVEIDDKRGARRRLLAKALQAIRHFITIRKRTAPRPLREDR
jgi:hypothetical protein